MALLLNCFFRLCLYLWLEKWTLFHGIEHVWKQTSQTGRMKCGLKRPISLHCLSGAKGLLQLQTLHTRPPKWDELNLSCRNWSWAKQKLIWRFSGSEFGFRPFYPGTVPLRIQAFTPCTFGKGRMFPSAGISCSSMGLSSLLSGGGGGKPSLLCGRRGV